MVQSISINSANDMYLGTDGNIVIDTAQEALSDICKCVAQAQLGEEVLTSGKGMPSFQAFWSGTTNIALYEAALRQAIEAVDGVTGVQSLTYSIANGAFSYTAQISTTFGSTTISGSIS